MPELTAERIIPHLMKPTNGMLLEHLARYYFATPYVTGRVLDIACGTGYGAHMIAKSCKKKVNEIVGVDIDEGIIQYANKTYNHPRIKFQVADAIDPLLPKALGQFDTVLSFETIEHVADDRLFMRNIHELLRPAGKLVLSTPFGLGRGKPCGEPFHVHQFTKKEFKDLFAAFKTVEIYHQRGVTVEPPRTNVRYSLGVAICER